MPGLEIDAFPKVVYDRSTDVLYIALSRVRTGYVRTDTDLPDVRLCFSEPDDELFGIHVSHFSRQNPARLSQRVAGVIDLSPLLPELS